MTLYLVLFSRASLITLLISNLWVIIEKLLNHYVSDVTFHSRWTLSTPCALHGRSFVSFAYFAVLLLFFAVCLFWSNFKLKHDSIYHCQLSSSSFSCGKELAGKTWESPAVRHTPKAIFIENFMIVQKKWGFLRESLLFSFDKRVTSNQSLV